MNDFYKDTDWFCYQCTRSIFPFLNGSDEDFLISCYKLNHPMGSPGTQENIEKITKNLMDTNFLTEITGKDDDKHLDIDMFDPDKNFSFEDKCEYIFNCLACYTAASLKTL